jgi:molybdenum ABC transporter molybdate-binding protein
VKEFEEKNPATKVNVTYGSSGNFFAQIQNGAPFDLLFSADIGYPRKLAEEGLGADDVFLYAIGRIVVWVSKDSPVAVDKLGIKALLEPSIRKIAVSNPEHAPYGRAAVAAMKALNIYDQVAPRLVYGENIAQTAQFVQSGAADVGLLPLAVEVFRRSRSSVAHCPASDGIGLLRANLIAIGPHSPIGQAYEAITGRGLPFSFQGFLVASVLYSLPFAVQPFTAAIATVVCWSERRPLFTA